MRNYTSKSDKVEIYSQKYNMSKEDINRILSEHEAMLTFDELKIKYDCETLGKLPDWLTEEKLDLIIKKGVNKHYRAYYNEWTTRDEMYNYMHEFLRKQLHKFKNESQLALAIPNRMIWLAKQQSARASYNLFSLDDTLSSPNNQGEISITYIDITPSKDISQKEVEFVENIRCIKSQPVKTLLIVIGYLVCEIHCLRELYLELLRTSNDELQKSIKNLEEIAYYNDDIEINRELTNKSIRKKSLKVQDIISKLKIKVEDISGEYNTTDNVLQCLQDYVNKNIRGDYVG